MGKTPRTYKGARTPQSLKEVRASARRNAVQQPQRTAAKTLVARALEIISGNRAGSAATAVAEAASSLDRAAKKGAIHRNAAARRKSRLAKKAARAAAHPAPASDRVDATSSKAASASPAKRSPRKSTATGTAAKSAAKAPAKRAPKAQ